jgi:hypothetical protein
VLGAGAVAAIGAALPAAAAQAAAAIGGGGHTGSDLPSLSVEALATLNHFHSIAAQAQGDWSGMGIESVDQHGDDGFHMQLPYMLYALAVAQHSKTPAYRELYKASMNGLIEKMKRNEVWDYWEKFSTGEDHYDEAHHHLVRKPEADPIKTANVMYSGHILPMLAMYEMFYRDGRWSAPDAFTLERLTPAAGFERFPWDMDSVQRNTVRQFVESDYLGLECYVDTIFPTTCLLFPLHGLIHYDHLKGTKVARDVISKHVNAWRRISTLYHMDKIGRTPYVLEPSRHSVGLSDSVAFGKTQFMNVFAPEYTRAAYPFWRKSLFDLDANGMLIPKPDSSRGEIPLDNTQPMTPRREKDNYPPNLTGSIEQLAHKVPPAALEVGDASLAAAALRYANHHNPPVWSNGELYYERNDEHGTPRFLNRRASILLGSGHVWSENAYRNIYDKPWGKTELEAPEVQSVDYPNVLVSQAYHDPRRDALHVTILPHGIVPSSQRPKALETSFRVVRLDPRKRYVVLRDGQATGDESSRQADGMVIRTRLAGAPQRFEIVAA